MRDQWRQLHIRRVEYRAVVVSRGAVSVGWGRGRRGIAAARVVVRRVGTAVQMTSERSRLEELLVHDIGMFEG